MFFLTQTISGGSGDAGGCGQKRGRGDQLLRVPLHDGRQPDTFITCLSSILFPMQLFDAMTIK